MKKEILSKIPNPVPLGYYLFMTLLVISWPLYYRPEITTAYEMFMALAHNTAVVGFLLVLDIVVFFKLANIVIRGMVLVYLFFVHLSALTLYVSAISVTETLTILALGGEMFRTIAEAGFPWYVLVLLIPLLALLLLAGYGLSRFIPANRFPGKSALVPLVLFIALPVLLVMEQAASRNDSYYFTRRQYPGSYTLHLKNSRSVTTTLKKDFSIQPGTLDTIDAPEKKQNVLFILLESFRHDAMTRENTPHLWRLAQKSITFNNAYTNGIYTALAWNVLLMNRPVWTVSRDAIFQFGHDTLKELIKKAPNNVNLERLLKFHKNKGSFNFRVLKKAGYSTGIISSANMDWFRFIQRIKGTGGPLDYFYSPYDDYHGKPRNWLDAVTVQKALIHMREQKGPFFLLVQLDATHWTYYPDRKYIVHKPSATSINMLRLITRQDILPVRNKYLNAVRTVDDRIGKLVTYLETSGRLKDTAVIVISDHGEGFTPGHIGHTRFHPGVNQVYLSMYLPGKQHRQCKAVTSHIDIFPTLFTHLGINGDWKHYTMGSDRLATCPVKEPVLIFHGSLTMAELVYQDKTIRYITRISANRITATPVFTRNHEDQSITMITDDHREYNRHLLDALK